MKAYGKVILRSITRSKARFFAIFAIMALGSGFFAGISATAPDMRQTVDSYLDRQNFMDVSLLSTLGFSKQDVQAVSHTKGVEAVMPTWSEDVMSHLANADEAIRMHALPEKGAKDTGSSSMNRPVLVSGRWPQNTQECVLDQKKSLVKQSLKLGDEVTVREQVGQKLLKNTKFKVTGFVQSPMYLTFTLGNTNIGNGQLNRYMYVLPQTFSSSVYTQLAVKVKDAAQLNSFTQAYQDQVQPVCSRLTEVGKQRSPLRKQEIIAPEQKKLRDGRKAYDSQKISAEKQLSTAKEKLADASVQIEQNAEKLQNAQQQIAEGEKKLKEARTSYTANEAQYEQKKQEADTKLSAASQQLQAGRSTLQKAQEQIDSNKLQLDAQEKKLTDAKSELDQQSQKLSAAQTQLEASRRKLEESSGEVEQARQALAQLETAGQGATQEAASLRKMVETYEQQSAQLKTAEQTLEQNQQAFQQAQQSYKQQSAAAQPKLEQAQQKIADAENHIQKEQQKLDRGEASYQLQQQQAENQFTAAREKLSAAKAQIDQKTQELQQAKRQLASGQQQLAAAKTAFQENQKKYNQSQKDTQTKLAAAAQKLADGEKQLNALQNPVWHVLNRDKNLGYNSFTSDANRMQSISHMFPVFFFLVAALVVLTTMTRMVEEERSEIGAYKALGFSRKAIAGRYLLYALFVSLSGSLVGVVIGCMTLPTVCWNAYRLMYNAPAIVPRVNLFYSFISCLASTAITVVATFSACWAALQEKPAALLQPKAPKPGKRILLEHITPIWQRMNFSAKVTARNLFRYKKRLVMTVVGIAGCTSLMLTGFGLKDSISHIVSNQYTDLSLYNFDMNLKSSLTDSTKAILNDKSHISRWMQYAYRSADVKNAAEKTMSANLLVPEQAGDLPKFIRLRNRRSKATIPFGRNSVVVTEKLANRLKLKPGSKITLPDSSGKVYPFTVTGVTENYIYHYVYIDPQLYQQVTGETPQYRSLWGIHTGSGKADLNRDLGKQPEVSTVIFMDDIMKNFDNMIQALNSVVLVLIFCAGMLSFVVLYNLTNINITERCREMATLRVLGFYVHETAEYIYKETTILTWIGCAFGLVLGIFMHRAVISTVEVDVCMFGRSIAPLSYLWSILLTLGFTAVVDLLMFPKFKKINMVESLKSVD